MSSPQPPEDHSNTKSTSATTSAFQKKRSRRVSFAENTIHIFERDEESGSNPDEDGGSSDRDNDNFFGPVSTSFIRRNLSDSAASDDNHDQTMDSTAFSMHFRSIARSVSDGELVTSTGVHLSFDEKTPTGPTPSSVPSDKGSSMLLTLQNKPNDQRDVSSSKLSSGSNSNDMSLVGEYHNKYNYGNLSPALNALLTEDRNDLHLVSHDSMLQSPTKARAQVLENKENVPDLMDFSYGPDNKMEGITSHEELNKVVPANNQNASGPLSPIEASKVLSPNQSITDTLTVKRKEPVENAFVINSSLESLVTRQSTPLNPRNVNNRSDDVMEKENESPFVGPITHVSDRPSHLLLNGVSHYKSPRIMTPSDNQASLFPRTESLQHDGSISSLQKSMSKLRILKDSPFSAALILKLENSSSRSLFVPTKMAPFSSLLEKSDKSPNINNKSEIPKNLMPITREEDFGEVASQIVLRSENIWPREHMQPNDLTSADIGYGHKGDDNNIGSLPLSNRSSKKLKKATTAKFRVSPYRTEKQSTQHHESLNFGPGHVGGLEESISNRRLLTPLNVAGSSLEENVREKANTLDDVRCNSETKMISDDIEHETFRSISRGSDITPGRMNTSLVLNGRMVDSSCQKNLADRFGRSPLNQEVHRELHNSNIDTSHVENLNPTERKRKAEAVTTEKFAKIKMSSNSDLELPTDLVMSSIGPNLEHLATISTRISKETKILSHSVDKMNLHAIDCLVDILGQHQKSKTYELLYKAIQSQTIVNSTSKIQDKRAAETKLLLCNIVHEQAKLQLMHVKRERLLKNVQSVVSGIQESEALKLNHIAQKSLAVQLIHSDTIESVQECQVENDKVTSMREEIKDIDGRISNLTKSFQISSKMKGEHTPADTIALVNDHLMKKARHQIIRKDLQLWVVEDLKSSKDHHNVVLNYLDLVNQRLTVTAGIVPSISVSNILNETNINKNFKDMNALTAFGFVFDAGVIQKHVNATSLAQETQTTSHILGNLVDVMEEIQLARIELKTLIYARFHTSLVECLDLELYFFGSNSRKKATVTLNTSCLKRGIYPSEIVTCQIDVPVDESQKSSTQTLSAEISAAVKDLRVGFSRIIRLCRCVSQLVSS
ncbi:hypothetical protein CTI12_AA017120 [Artemisia annua]|uniref:Knl1 C-terminal RWD domain-containing protein n=1 Tax=Artemisia annua TaxID=35608 RepID=A0A2U1QKP0_ARTAN|nr:hypothetical protein CTI12_AA017120 [Artemisia annua]